MRRHLGICWIAIFFALLFSDLSLVKAKTTRQRNKSNRKGLQTNRTNPTTVQPSEKLQGTFIRNGRKLVIDFGEEGNSYYATHYSLFPDEIHYAGCAESNVTKEVFISNCVNATRVINKLEPLEEQNISDIYSRILEQLIKELCALNYCEFRTGKGTGLRLSLDQYVMVYLVILTCLIVK
ncbi:prion-like protein doppel [Monodelphis domestica]|uniref:Doppel protein Dpl n=1 Tax=Monodelphis domestica TaxID=13616 RepID=A2BDH5_MONDO|nr:prion-like protein doppel [Monodelphis domestica]CAJ75789.1 TPA: doppel protein Dpl [Monodelphis domestica]